MVLVGFYIQLFPYYGVLLLCAPHRLLRWVLHFCTFMFNLFYSVYTTLLSFRKLIFDICGSFQNCSWPNRNNDYKNPIGCKRVPSAAVTGNRAALHSPSPPIGPLIIRTILKIWAVTVGFTALLVLGTALLCMHSLHLRIYFFLPPFVIFVFDLSSGVCTSLQIFTCITSAVFAAVLAVPLLLTEE